MGIEEYGLGEGVHLMSWLKGATKNHEDIIEKGEGKGSFSFSDCSKSVKVCLKAKEITQHDCIQRVLWSLCDFK